MQFTSGRREYLRRLSYHNLKILRGNLSKGIGSVPVLEHDWKINTYSIFFISDVDGVWTGKVSLPEGYFNFLFRKPRYERFSNEILDYERQINAAPDNYEIPFAGMMKCFLKMGLTLEDHNEACQEGSNADLVPFAHEALKELYEIPPYAGIGWNSTSWNESLNLFSFKKRLPVSCTEGSNLEFHNGKFTGRYNINYGPNKIGGKDSILRRFGHNPNLTIYTISDSMLGDNSFRYFVGMGGVALWADRSFAGQIRENQEIVEANVPEMRDDMRVFPKIVKVSYRTNVISRCSSPSDMAIASVSTRKVIERGKTCLESPGEVFEAQVKKFVDVSQPTLIFLSRFDFPRHSSGIDYQYVKLISAADVEDKKEAILAILEIYKRNFPECLAEDGWIDDIRIE